MRKTIAAVAAFGLIATVFAGGAALARGGGGGGGGHGGGGGGGHGGFGGHGGGFHDGGGGHGFHGDHDRDGFGDDGFGFYGGGFDYGDDYDYGDSYDDSGGAYPDTGDSAVPPDMQAAPGSGSQYWYYCNATRSYYPYVKTCTQGWMRILPTPSSQPPG